MSTSNRLGRRLAWVHRLGALEPSWLENVAVILIALAAAIYAERFLLFEPYAFQTDSMTHEFWMRQFQNPALFNDPLTDAVKRAGFVPPGVVAVDWLGSWLLDPVDFAEWVGVALTALSIWFVFHLAKLHTEWRPGPWLAAAVFAFPWEIHRFSGGHARAYFHPIVLLTVVLLIKKRRYWAAVVPPLAVFFYPPAALVSLGLVAVSWIRPQEGRYVDNKQALAVFASVLLFVAATLGPRLVTGDAPELLTKSEARALPEFSNTGQIHFFRDNLKVYLKANYSGFDLRTAGSIVVISAVLLLVVRPHNVRLLRREMWSMLAVGLFLFLVAQVTLFRLYHPHRYTYVVLPFCSIVIAVCWHPTWRMFMRRLPGAPVLAPFVVAGVLLLVVYVATALFPLGPELSMQEFGSWLEAGAPPLLVALFVGLPIAAISAARSNRAARVAVVASVVSGALLAGAVAHAGGGQSPVALCKRKALFDYLASLPAHAIIAGTPFDMNCVVVASARPVVISKKLYQPFDKEYIRVIRPRMFATVHAFYGESMDDVLALRRHYGADYLVVGPIPGPGAWRLLSPFGELVRELTSRGRPPAIFDLPDRCRTWRKGPTSIFDMACLEGATST